MYMVGATVGFGYDVWFDFWLTEFLLQCSWKYLKYGIDAYHRLIVINVSIIRLS